MADEKKAEQKEKKAKRGKKEEAKKVGFAANIEEGLESKPARMKLGVPAGEIYRVGVR